MAKATGRISLRLDPDDLQALDELVARRGYSSRSDAVRDAIEAMLAVPAVGLSTVRMELEVPLGDVERLDDMVDLGLLPERRAGAVAAIARGLSALRSDRSEEEQWWDGERERLLGRRKGRRSGEQVARP